MTDYQVLASICGGGPDCPKVARRVPGVVAIVGSLVTNPADLAALGVGPGEGAVEITEKLYCDGHSALGGQAT